VDNQAALGVLPLLLWGLLAPAALGGAVFQGSFFLYFTSKVVYRQLHGRYPRPLLILFRFTPPTFLLFGWIFAIVWLPTTPSAASDDRPHLYFFYFMTTASLITLVVCVYGVTLLLIWRSLSAQLLRFQATATTIDTSHISAAVTKPRRFCLVVSLCLMVSAISLISSLIIRLTHLSDLSIFQSIGPMHEWSFTLISFGTYASFVLNVWYSWFSADARTTVQPASTVTIQIQPNINQTPNNHTANPTPTVLPEKSPAISALTPSVVS
jgi:hypothetical protein